MDLLDIKKLALLGIAGGLLFAASDQNAVYAGDYEDSGVDKEAHGCNNGNSCDGKDSSNGEDDDSSGDDDDE